MGQSIPFRQHIARPPLAMPARARVESVPWTIWCMVAGVVCGMIGGLWDISWHMSIGRDTFWTPAHIMIQMTGVLVGIACAYMILTATFGSDARTQDASVKIWGFRGPLGAFIAVWGCVAMLTSAPFDNWWHNAYGLDVKIVSPPHTLLSLGSLAIKIGAMALMAGLVSRASERVRRTLGLLMLFIGASCVTQMGLILTGSTWPNEMHTAACYLAVAIAIPPALIAPAWSSRWRWGCTAVAGIYTGTLLAFEWILPLFPAQPKLGPVYQHVTHLIPLRFPLLLIVPAIVLDLLWRKAGEWGRWRLATGVSVEFSGGAVAVCGFYDVARGAQPDFRDGVFCLFRSGEFSLRSVQIRWGRNARPFLDADRSGAGFQCAYGAAGTGVGRLDASDAKVSARARFSRVHS